MSEKPSNILSIVAHPDDEAWKNAGYLAQLAHNSEIDSLVMTDANAQGIGGTRLQEQVNMMRILGMNNLYPVGAEKGFKDGELSNSMHPALVQAIIGILDEAVRRKKPYTKIVTIGVYSGHGDHFAVDNAAQHAFRERQEIEQFVQAEMSPDEYPLWPDDYFVAVPRPNISDCVPIDIESTRPQKIAAIRAHVSQLDGPGGGQRHIERVLSTKPIEYYRIINRT